jgi:hypothetical protein
MPTFQTPEALSQALNAFSTDAVAAARSASEELSRAALEAATLRELERRAAELGLQTEEG